MEGCEEVVVHLAMKPSWRWFWLLGEEPGQISAEAKRSEQQHLEEAWI